VELNQTRIVLFHFNTGKNRYLAWTQQSLREKLPLKVSILRSINIFSFTQHGIRKHSMTYFEGLLMFMWPGYTNIWYKVLFLLWLAVGKVRNYTRARKPFLLPPLARVNSFFPISFLFVRILKIHQVFPYPKPDFVYNTAHSRFFYKLKEPQRASFSYGEWIQVAFSVVLEGLSCGRSSGLAG